MTFHHNLSQVLTLLVMSFNTCVSEEELVQTEMAAHLQHHLEDDHQDEDPISNTVAIPGLGMYKNKSDFCHGIV